MLYEITIKFKFDTSQWHDAEEGPPPKQNFDPRSSEEIAEFVKNSLALDEDGMLVDGKHTVTAFRLE